MNKMFCKPAIMDAVKEKKLNTTASKSSASKKKKIPQTEEVEPSSGIGMLVALEPRIMFDGAALATGAEVLQDTTTQDSTAIPGIDGDTSIDSTTETPGDALWSSGLSLAAPSDRKEIVFIDTGVDDYQTLMEGIDPNAEVILLDSTRDGVEQIAEILGERTDIDAVHVISHGDSGELQLGTGVLNITSMQGEYADELAIINQALTEEADFLIYGCNFGEGESGVEASTLLAELTGADIAASSDLTGAEALGGDWELEVQTGTIESDVIVDQQAQESFAGVLDITTGLVGHWTFDAGATDSSGNSYDGTLTGDASIDTTDATDIVGEGKLALDGTGDYVNLDTHISGFSGLTEGTISAWVKMTDTGESTIFGLSDKDEATELIKFGIEGGQLKWLNLNPAFDDVIVYSTATVNDGAWHHVAVTVNSSGNTLYIDGAVASVSYSSGSSSTTAFFDDITNIDALDIGRSVRGGVAEAEYDGLTDDVRVYNRALSAADIAELATLESSPGSAIWSASGDGTPNVNDWDGTSFGTTTDSADLTFQLRIVEAAEAPTRDEKIVIGVDATIGQLKGEIWDGSTWTALPFSMGFSADNTAQSFDVVYESQSGDAMVVWNNGAGGTASVSYRIWDGSTWSAEQTITAPDAGVATQLRLAANPTSDEVVLIVSDDNTDEWAAVWDGSGWGNTVVLDTVTTSDRNEISVVFESQSGHAMVVYDGVNNYNDLTYRTWDGTTWSGQQTLTLPNTGAETDVKFTTLASDPTSDRIALGVVSGGTQNHAVFAVWDGSAWGDTLMATTSGWSGNSLNAAVAFESQSGDLLVTYGEVATTPRYQTWSSSGGWSGEMSLPDIGAYAQVMELTSDPLTNSIMLGVQDSDSDLHYLRWNGEAWGMDNEVSTNTGETVLRPFTFVFDAAAPNAAPVNTVPGAQAVAEDTTLAISSISVNDTNGNLSTVQLSVTNGTLNVTLSGSATISMGANGTNTLTLSGSQADINATLATLTYQGTLNYVGADTLTVLSTDSNGATDSDNVAITVGMFVDTTSDVSDGDTSSTAALLANMGADGKISLREAIEATNNTTGIDTISFAITGTGVHTINLAGSALPTLTDAVIIDATTDDSFAANSDAPAIILDGGSLVGQFNDGFRLSNTADGSTIKGFVIRDFSSNAIHINAGSDNNTISGNYLGQFNADGTDAGASENIGNAVIYIEGGSNMIGGVTAADRNVIAGGDDGILLSTSTATNNTIIGNYIGTDATGMAVIGNVYDGIRIQSDAHTNTIGGATIGHSNIISGNNQDGIQITTDGNTVQNNYIGVAADGTTALGNLGSGIYLSGTASNNIIGGIGVGNVVGANSLAGIELDGTGTGNILQGNFIGTDATGTVDLGNQQNGVLFENGISSTLIGGTATGEGNIIAFNGKGGSFTAGILGLNATSTDNAILGNSIYSNVGVGIDLATTSADDVTLNDSGDSDAGANNLQNFPVLTSATTTGTQVTIAGSINTEVNSYYRIEFFASTTQDGSGYGEAETYLGFVNVATDGSGNATISTTLSASVASGAYITATATKSNATYDSFTDTSEFAQNITAVSNAAPTITSNGGGTTASINVEENQTAVTTVTASDADLDTLTYSITGGLDAAKFSIDSSTGALVFVTAPDYEMPSDSNGDNVYVVMVQVSDGNGGTDTQTINVTVTDVANTLTVTTTVDNADSGITDGNSSHTIEWLNANMGGDGAISFREAIIAANNTSGLDTIAFNLALNDANHVYYQDDGLANSLSTIVSTTLDDASITDFDADYVGGASQGFSWWRMQPTSELPAITDAVIIDGSTQAGWMAGQPVIEINGSLAGTGTYLDGLTLNSSTGSTIRGLVINQFDWAGIQVNGTGGHTIVGNFIGTDVTGTVDLGNRINGIEINSADNNVIGGTTLADRNIISGNNQGEITLGTSSTGNIVQGNYLGLDVTGSARLGGSYGLRIYGDSNQIGGTGAGEGNVIAGVRIESGGQSNVFEGNYVGTDAAGASAIGGVGYGFTVYGSNNVIGGTAAGAGNVISGNSTAGVYLTGTSATGNLVQGNLIGTDVNGTAALGNGDGVRIRSGASNNTIGGTTAGARNTISGNTSDGIEISGATTTGNVIQGNYIGTDVTGTLDLGNAGHGIRIESGASTNTIGGTTAATRNVIAGNDLDGIYIHGTGTSGNVVQGNYIGLDATGTTAIGNGDDGVWVGTGATGTTIGGTTAGAGNVISGNIDVGIVISGTGTSGTVVQGNYIGTNAAGTGAVANGDDGIWIGGGATNSTIGGTTAGARNIISGNTMDGVQIHDVGTSNNVVQGNYIGTDVTGNVALANGDTGVSISGGATGNTIGGTTSAHRNVISGNTAEGVHITGSGTDSNTVSGNYIGVDSTGVAALGNGIDGVRISASASSNTIGGTTAGERNIISGNADDGIHVSGTGNIIQGNYIGTDVAGTADLGNTGHGINLQSATNTLIGGSTVSARNVIVGNNAGIRDQNTTGTIIQGNYIGVDATGTAALGNSFGISAWSSSNGIIGGSGANEGNLIGGNTIQGILLYSSSGYTVQGNYIGTDATGTLDLGNGQHGITFSSTSTNHLIGGTGVGEGNVIAFSGGDGINVPSSGSNISILGNQIYTNTELGIDLGGGTEDGFGVTANDAGDADTGANNLQNYPVLTTVTTTGSEMTVTGSLNGTANTTFRIEFFASSAADGSNYGEAERYLGFATVTTDGTGNATINSTLTVTVAVGEFLTATATVDLGGGNYGNTSEFGQNVTATSNTAPVNTVPGAQTVDEDTSLAISGVSINDTDGNLSTVQLSVTNGTLNVTLSGAATISAGATGSSTLTLSGSQTDINATLASLTYQGNLNFNGNDTLTVISTDTNSASDTDTVAITVNAINDAPTITGLDGDTLAYTEGDGAVVIDQTTTAAVTDVDSTNFDTGTLTVSFQAGSDSAEDVLAIRDQGAGPTNITVSGSTVSYGGTQIGTFTGGSGGTDLVITLDADADATAVSALIQNITYENTDTDNPTTGARTVRYVLTDGDGGTSANYDTTVTVAGANDQAVVDLNGVDGGGNNFATTFTEGSGAVNVTDTDATISDVDHTTYDTLGINLSGFVDGGSEQITVAGYTFTYGTAETVVQTVGVTDFEIDFDGSGFSIQRDISGEMPEADLQTLLRGITYENLSENPTVGNRTLDFIPQDGDALVGLTSTSTITVAATNDAPVVTNLGGDALAYTEGDGAVVIDQTITAAVTDVDSSNFDTGTLTVSFQAGSDSAEDVLSIRDQGAGPTNITVLGSTVSYGGTQIGTFTGGSGGTDLVITLDADADATAVSALIQNITYENTDTDNPTTGARTVRYVLTDGDGGTSANYYDTTVTVSTSFAFTGGNLISTTDVDGNLASTQLTVSNGTLNVTLSGSATISAGANGSGRYQLCHQLPGQAT